MLWEGGIFCRELHSSVNNVGYFRPAADVFFSWFICNNVRYAKECWYTDATYVPTEFNMIPLDIEETIDRSVNNMGRGFKLAEIYLKAFPE